MTINSEIVRNGIAAAMLVLTLGGGVIAIKVDIAELRVRVAELQKDVDRLVSVQTAGFDFRNAALQ
jgi:hypothetical protein